MTFHIGGFPKKFLVVGISMSVGLVGGVAMAGEACPEGGDPIYCRIAKETGGKIYNEATKDGGPQGDADSSAQNKKSEAETRREPKKYAKYTRDIGCDVYPKGREFDICQSISDNLEWQITGHATFAIQQVVTWDTVRHVYCDAKISETDLPVLGKMCGNDIGPYMSCVGPQDARLANGVEFLIKTVLGRGQIPDDLKGTIYNPQSEDYVLKKGCIE